MRFGTSGTGHFWIFFFKFHKVCWIRFAYLFQSFLWEPNVFTLVQLKRAKVTRTDSGLFYSSCTRSIMDYAVPAFHFSLAKYLMQELERIQKRAMSIICPGVNDHEALVIMTLRN